MSQSLATLNFTGVEESHRRGARRGQPPSRGSHLSGGSGALWLDQLVLANESGWDSSTAPTVALSLSRHQRTARITDASQNALSADRMSLTVDGQAVPFTWDAGSGTLTATLSGLARQQPPDHRHQALGTPAATWAGTL